MFPVIRTLNGTVQTARRSADCPCRDAEHQTHDSTNDSADAAPAEGHFRVPIDNSLRESKRHAHSGETGHPCKWSFGAMNEEFDCEIHVCTDSGCAGMT